MNNKFLKIFTIMVITLLIATAAFVITSNIFSNKGSNENKETGENDKVIETINTGNESNNEDKVEEKNVVLNSKIGIELLNKVELPLSHSDSLIKTLKTSGINNDYMLLYTYSIINTNYDYHLLLKNMDDYSGNYILKSDFENVAKSYFGEDISLEYKDIMYKGDYDKENERYNIIATGYASDKLDYCIQVPFEINQIGNEYIVHCYEIYATNNFGISDEEIENSESYNEIFYDSGRKRTIEKIIDSEFESEQRQVEYIRKKIDSGSIDTKDLEKLTYKLQKSEKTNNYIIKSVSFNN